MTARVPIGVVIVTHNHGATIEATLASLAGQSEPADRVIVVDCASDDRAWMERWRDREEIELIELETNAGFSGGNNLGWRALNAREGFVLFLNPDVVMPFDLLARFRMLVCEERNLGFGAFGPRLVGWDFGKGIATGAVDSTGIFPKRLGGWADRRSDSPPSGDTIENVPALCGAFFLARVEGLRAVKFSAGTIWDERYFAYKEDIELSLRLRRAGWQLGLWHGAEAGHGRGWTSRRAMSREARLMSARNELRLHRTYAPWRVPFSLAKLAAVRWFNC